MKFNKTSIKSTQCIVYTVYTKKSNLIKSRCVRQINSQLSKINYDLNIIWETAERLIEKTVSENLMRLSEEYQHKLVGDYWEDTPIERLHTQ